MIKCMSLIIFLNTRCSGADVTVNGKRLQLLTTLQAKLFHLLRVLAVWVSSIIDGLLSPGLLENLNNRVSSRSIWLYMILWVRSNFFKSPHLLNWDEVRTSQHSGCHLSGYFRTQQLKVLVWIEPFLLVRSRVPHCVQRNVACLMASEGPSQRTLDGNF